ncbi:MAG TPA: DUF2339 domain-containing protein [Allosphingosinicella sp.]|nr:DUF2339 domain-containing protein [Allosphingosinicella sp.]
MVWILLVGLIALFFVQSNQARRIARLERELEGRPGIAPRREEEDEESPPAEAPWPQPLHAPTSIGPREMAAWLAASPPAAPEREEDVEEAEAEEGPEPREPEEDREAPETAGALFERYVGGRMLIWVGGIAFALGGVFLVRYSIGRVTPGGRMILAALLGALLIAAAEFARSRPDGKVDPRVAQALVGAGILVLYATPYGSLILYHLISSTMAFGLMAAVTVLALILSLRHGSPAAVLGLAGGFATPALVGDPSGTAVPLLIYIGLLDVALFTLAQRRGWTWLALAATLLSFVWTGWTLAGPVNFAVAGGVFILGLSLAASLVRAGEGWHLVFARPAAIGLVQLAVLVGRTDIGATAWYLYGALALACFLLAGRRSEYRFLPAFALILALVLLAAKSLDHDPLAPSAAIGITLLFALGALPGALRGPDRVQHLIVSAAGFAAPILIMRSARPELLDRPIWGAAMAALALGPAVLAWLRRGSASRSRIDPALSFAAAASMLLLGVAAFDLVRPELLPAAWLLIATVAIYAARSSGDLGLLVLALLGAAWASLWVVGATPGLWETVGGSMVGIPALVIDLETPLEALQLLILPAAILFLIWHWTDEADTVARRIALSAAGIFLLGALYIFVKQIFGIAGQSDFIASGFAERAMINQALFVAGWVLAWDRIRMPWLQGRELRLIGAVLTAVAAARVVWFDMILHNPAFYDQNVGSPPVFNLLLPAFLLGAFWLYIARRRETEELVSGVWLGAFLACLILGVGLIVRQLFHGAILTGTALPNSEFYSYSLAGLLLAIALMLSGIRLPDKALRIAGLALLSATAVKIFIFDVKELEDIWRILSLFGLGAAGIGIGKLYATVLRSEAKPARA